MKICIYSIDPKIKFSTVTVFPFSEKINVKINQWLQEDNILASKNISRIQTHVDDEYK